MSLPHTPAVLTGGAHLRVSGLSKSYPDRRVLTDVSFTVSQGERVALIGENGAGKSTLLRLVAGVETVDAGEVNVPGRVGLLWQRMPFSPGSDVAAVCRDALAVPRALLREFEDATTQLGVLPEDPAAAARYSHALEAATGADVWTLGHRADVVLHGVGLGDVSLDRQVGTLSGGEQARLSLAWLLLARPDTLLLDEPTNHLDDAGISFLVATLSDWRGPVLFASHDRAFLDEVATGILDLDPAPRPNQVVNSVAQDGPTSAIGVTSWTGTFTDYLAARHDARERWQRQYRDEQAELTRLEQLVRDTHQVGHVGAAPRTESRAARKFYADRNATVVSRRVNDARRRFTELTQEQIRKPPRELSFAGLGAAPRRGHLVPSVVVAASGVTVIDRLRGVSIAVGRSEKWLVTGPNGSGKSTLLGVLDGSIEPSSGTVTRPRQVTVGSLAQDVHLEPGVIVHQLYQQTVGIDRAEQVPLTTFGLVHPRDATRPVGALSVGQQRRLALAMVLAHPPDLLILDEPTNHFALALASDLEESLAAYPGAVVIASHDRWLRRRWTGQRLDLPG